MQDIAFPLLVSGVDSVRVHQDEASFLSTLRLMTAKAQSDRVAETSRLFDNERREFRIRRLALTGRWRLLGWMRQPRAIAALELELVNTAVPLSEIVRAVHDVIANTSEFWDQQPGGLETVLRRIDLATSLADVRAAIQG